MAKTTGHRGRKKADKPSQAKALAAKQDASPTVEFVPLNPRVIERVRQILIARGFAQNQR